MKYFVPEWRPGFENDPRYVALGGQLAALAEEIRAVLAPTGFGGVIDRAKATALENRRRRLVDEIADLKKTFIVQREIDIPDGVAYSQADGPAE